MPPTIERDWTTAAGLRAICILHHYSGTTIPNHRCGYVAVPPGHPLHSAPCNKPCPALPALSPETTMGKRNPITILTMVLREDSLTHPSPETFFDVHGSLTFSALGGSYPDPFELAPASWWFGFDCIHAGDNPIEPHPTSSSFRDPAGIVRSFEYVVAECESLAAQITAAFPLGAPPCPPTST